MKTPHSHYRKGKKLFIILRNGNQIVDKFIERRARGIQLERFGIIAMRDIRSITFDRTGGLCHYTETRVFDSEKLKGILTED